MGHLVIYDDREAITDAGRGFIGIERYSQLLYRKRTLDRRLADLVERAGLGHLHHLRDDRDVTRVHALWEQRGRRDLLVYLPSCLAPRDEARTELFLAKIRHVQESFYALVNDDPAAPLLTAAGRDSDTLLARLDHGDWPGYLEQHRQRFRMLPADATGLVNLRLLDVLVEFLTTTFDARHFNAIHQDGFVITKRSADVDKMRREYRLYEHLPERLRMYFLPPFDFLEEAVGASYRLERLCVPDLAIQWIHGVMGEADVAILLDRIRRFLRERPRRRAERRAARELYVGKCERRLQQLAAMPQAERVAQVLGTKALDDLLERYARLWDRLGSQRTHWHEAVSHGDLCFSNILYDRQTRLMKFIDPRGADHLDDSYLDEYYDLAKLSHSICGGYDFINHDLIDLCYDDGLALELHHAVAQEDFAPHRDRFLAAMAEDGYDPDLIRCYEASLFLSMLPLHSDHPKKMVAFALTARAIIDQLEQRL